ncbi:Uncharacterised protein [Salmonella enterica subsp. enterica serovar Typhi]|nr:Uncharacterised protein [Salmonella enterica subsp. enterica serovar Typhi]CWY18974.1 Uncharacterised protein [Salmonella enterica subsp. enterica serovar Typhi]CWY30648.1 Uncharacterised protein [Salmonella enterica subsp. enterica serovar Typhi]CWY36920.1 Uncharacterised protein [Salmonella enterica subsp. enterica serovar Typhi]CWZ41537.1 Uncharacterised protein [Salmonella enterica subsp. enterica serovar Typhi]
MAIKVNINIRLLPKILRNVRLPVGRVNKVDDAQGNIVNLLLIILPKQSPAAGRSPQTVNFPQRAFRRRRKKPPKSGCQQQDRAAYHPRYKNVWRYQTEKE